MVDENTGLRGSLNSTMATTFGKSCSAAIPKRPLSSKSRGTKPCAPGGTSWGAVGTAKSTTCTLPVNEET